jgi:predicted transcriptional regulator
MKEVNLSFKQIEYYLKHLLSNNFIKKEGKVYRTTEKGLDVKACKICHKLIEQ